MGAHRGSADSVVARAVLTRRPTVATTTHRALAAALDRARAESAEETSPGTRTRDVCCQNIDLGLAPRIKMTMDDRIRRRAFLLFKGDQARTSVRELDDWLQAEREELARPTPPTPPTHLYKYVGTDRHHFEIVENLEIRFSQPSSLNDPLDCQPQVIAPRDPQATVDQIIQRNIAQHPGRWSNPTIARARAQLLGSYTTGIAQRLQESADVLRRNLDLVGVLSLSDALDSVVMWAHYADQHRGFVIEFDTRFAPLIQRSGENGWQGLPVPVAYQPNRPEVHCDSTDLQVPDELVLVKTSAWSYEREWRVVRDRSVADRTVAGSTVVSLFSVDPRAISAIYVGKDASANTVQRLRDILAGNAALGHVRLARASISVNGSLVFA